MSCEPLPKLSAFECVHQLRSDLARTGKAVRHAGVCITREKLAVLGFEFKFRGRSFDLHQIRTGRSGIGRTGFAMSLSLRFGHGIDSAVLDSLYTDVAEFLRAVAVLSAAMIVDSDEFLKKYAEHQLDQNQRHQEYLNTQRALSAC